MQDILKYIRIGTDVYESEYDNRNHYILRKGISHLVAMGIMREARDIVLSGQKPLTPESRTTLMECVKQMGHGFYDKEKALKETKKVANIVSDFVGKKSLIVAIGSSPDKIGFVLESMGHDVVYTPLTSNWLESNTTKSKFLSLFDGLFTRISPKTSIVFIDFCDTFASMFSVDTMFRTWCPRVHEKSKFIALYNKEYSNKINLRTAETLLKWKTIHISESVWNLSKNNRCTPAIDENGEVLPLTCDEKDACDAIRCLLSPKHFSNLLLKKTHT